MSQSIPDKPVDDHPEGKEAETDWKAEARKWEARSKANHKRARELEEKAARLDALEEAKKTDAEKLAAAEAKLAAYEKAEQAREWAAEVSAETGVPAGLLRGGSLEEVRAHGEALAQYMGKGRTDPVPSAGKRPDTTISDELAAARRLFGR